MRHNICQVLAFQSYTAYVAVLANAVRNTGRAEDRSRYRDHLAAAALVFERLQQGDADPLCSFVCSEFTGRGVQLESKLGKCGLHLHFRRAVLITTTTREIGSYSFVYSWIGVVARDGIEPPTSAFSGPLTDDKKFFRISVFA